MADISKINLNGTLHTIKDIMALADAPADGKTYGRNNGAWAEVTGGGGGGGETTYNHHIVISSEVALVTEQLHGAKAVYITVLPMKSANNPSAKNMSIILSDGIKTVTYANAASTTIWNSGSGKEWNAQKYEIDINGGYLSICRARDGSYWDLTTIGGGTGATFNFAQAANTGLSNLTSIAFSVYDGNVMGVGTEIYITEVC